MSCVSYEKHDANILKKIDNKIILHKNIHYLRNSTSKGFGHVKNYKP